MAARLPRRLACLASLAVAAAGGALAASAEQSLAAPTPGQTALVDRVTWGVTPADAASIARMGEGAWLKAQLHPADDGDHLPAAAQAQVEAMAYLQVPMVDLVRDAQLQQAAANQMTDPALKAAAKQTYAKAMDDAARQSAMREILRDIYSPDQLREQMSWFWFNHFNVQMYKSNIRLMVGDYEDHALRPHALGRFRDLLEATLRHPAMLRYLDNADNAAGHINENYAREIMELHTLGVGSGYTQGDVQELARILTGVGIDAKPDDPKLPPQLQGQLIRQGLFEFNPARHDYGDKTFLGRRIRGRGFGEVEEALDLLARNPATASHISRELAVYFVSDDPPASLVKSMTDVYLRSDGDIARVLETMLESPEFKASLGGKFKDPLHYAVSAVRLAWADRVIVDPGPVMNFANRMGEGLYAHETPDGYAMAASSWNGPGQMETRFEIARQLGSGGAGLFRPQTPGASEPPVTPDIRTAAQAGGLLAAEPAATQAVLAQASAPKDWNTLFLASPAFMRR
jgi:uncharacterized protein (DUF1800 family)